MIKLLIVDDEPPIAEGLANVIQAADLAISSIKIAYSAEEALPCLEAFVFDIVISDIKLPEMNGIQLMKTVRRKWRHTKIIFLTGYADFAYAQEAVKLGASDFLLKPIEDDKLIESLRAAIAEIEKNLEEMISFDNLNSKLDHTAHVLQNELLQKVIQGKLADARTMIARFDEVGIRLLPEAHVFSIMIRMDEWEKFKPDDNRLVLFAVRNILVELIDDATNIVMVPDNDRLLTVILQSTDAAGREALPFRLKDILRNIQDTVYRVLGVIVSVIYTTNAVTWEEFPQICRFMMSKLKLSFGTGKLISTHDQRLRIDYDLFLSRLEQLRTAIKIKDKTAFVQLVDGVFDELQTNNRTIECGFMYLEISSMIFNALLAQNKLQHVVLMDLEKMTNMYQNNDAHSLKAYLLELFGKLPETKDEAAVDRKSMIVSHSKAYIHNHLHEDISLDSLAQKLYINPSYLSRVFHSSTGEKLVPYIARVKMEKARQLLLDPKLKIQDIAEQLGYQSPNYFAKVFRSVHRLSPQECRVSYANEQK